MAENGPVERVSQAGPLSSVFLHLRIWLRAGALLAKFFPLLLLYPLTYLAPSLSTLWLHLLLKATETSGPTYIKLGQWASTRRDLFSEAFCVLFSKLHVRVAPHPWNLTEQFLRQAFGEDWGNVLSFETREPVGSGCVAQVYKAFASAAFLEKDRRLGLDDQSFLERLLLPKAELVGSNAVVSQASGHPDHLIPVAVKVSAGPFPSLADSSHLAYPLSCPKLETCPHASRPPHSF